MPKIIAGSLDEHRLEVRARLFEALAQLLRESPLEAITIAQLAATSGVGRTAIYNHFSDKDAIVVDFATSETDRFLESLADAIDNEASPEQRLRTYVRHYIASREQYHLDLGHQLIGSLSPEALAEMRAHVVAAQRALGSIIDAGIASQDFVQMSSVSAVILVHTCLQAPRVADADLEEFILGAVLARA
ncbi:MAG: TetR/AcrR family transcriptional regulator [Aeromicrobium sp.]|nr:MAG: TetR/AcrR family transcriptional regulator [Aeromicrobium sp.]